MCVLVLIVHFKAVGCSRRPKGKFGYFVKWKGYGDDDNSWVHEDDAEYLIHPLHMLTLTHSNCYF